MADAKGPAADSADAEEPTPKGWPMFTFFGSGPPYVNQDANVTTPEETAVNIQVLMNAEDSDLFVQEIVTAMYSGMATTYSDAPMLELYCTTPKISCRSSTTPTRRCRSSTARTGPRRSNANTHDLPACCRREGMSPDVALRPWQPLRRQGRGCFDGGTERKPVNTIQWY